MLVFCRLPCNLTRSLFSRCHGVYSKQVYSIQCMQNIYHEDESNISKIIATQFDQLSTVVFACMFFPSMEAINDSQTCSLVDHYDGDYKDNNCKPSANEVKHYITPLKWLRSSDKNVS